MKCVKEITPKGLLLPAAATRIAGLGGKGRAEYHILKSSIVVLKGQMTAMELLAAAQSLHDLSVELNSHLAKVCGQCDGCPEINGEGCPLLQFEEADVTLPDELREKAGIPEGAKLCAEVDEEKNAVVIFAAGYEHSLRDLPPETLEMFLAANICLGELEERLITGDTVYGGMS